MPDPTGSGEGLNSSHTEVKATAPTEGWSRVYHSSQYDKTGHPWTQHKNSDWDTLVVSNF